VPVRANEHAARAALDEGAISVGCEAGLPLHHIAIEEYAVGVGSWSVA
jgi:hypothetical protein